MGGAGGSCSGMVWEVCVGELVAHTVAWFGNALFQAGTSSDATKGIVVSQ